MKQWRLAIALAAAMAVPLAAQRGSDQPSKRRAAPAGSTSQSGPAPGSNATAPSGTAAGSGAAAPQPAKTQGDEAVTPLPATTIRVRGTISTYDANGGILALSTANGLVRFPVPAGTRVRHGGQTVDRAELKSLTGLRAAVRYSESGGHMTVESVNVFDTSERNPR